jgi:hypothetical protein
MKTEDQLYITLENEAESEQMIRLVMLKRDLGDNIFALVAIGYEGGGAWSEYYAVYELDEFHESILETKESLIGPDEESQYYDVYNSIQECINNYCDFNEEFVPYLKEELMGELRDDGDSKIYQTFWNWDDGIHLTASKNWQIQYRFSA